MIDCDLPVAAPPVSALRDHLEPYWRDSVTERGIRSLEPSYEPPGRAPRQPQPGAGTELAIVRPLAAIEAFHAEDLAAALAAGLNDWLRAEWLDRDPRLRGSITVAPQGIEAAVAEIDRLAPDRRFVQVLLPLRGLHPLGRRLHWPIYEACARHDLALAVRPGGNLGGAITPVGWPSHLVEDLAGQSQAFHSQVTSLVLEGALARHPGLRVALIGSGATWLPSLTWRLDKSWKGVRREVPWVDRPPSEAIRRAVRLTVPPVDAPPDAFAEVLDGMSGVLLRPAARDPCPTPSTSTPMLARRTRAWETEDMATVVATGLIDCDIHNQPASDARLRPYLPERWRRHLERFGARTRHGLAQGFPYPKATPGAARVDAWPPGGGPPGSSLQFLRDQLLDPLGVGFGILNCLHAGAGQVDPELGAALCRAVNDWQVAEWLEPEPRLRASIVLPYDDGELSAAEIDRVAGTPGFVQALMLVRTLEPIGRRRYWPIHAACERHGLPLGIHFGGYAGHPISSSGWPSFYLEDHTGMAMAFQAQLVSLVFEGVFERFPGLRVVCVEGGVAWLPALAWRMDRLFDELRDEVPELRRRPSEYLREHVWLTTQPVEEPERPEQLLQVFERIGRDRLLFATDYPHWDYDDPARAFPAPLPPGLRERVYADNARTLYGLPAAE